MKYSIRLIKYISIYEVDAIINNAEQGWEGNGTDDYHTNVLRVNKTIEIEFENDFKLMSYIKALQKLSNYGITVVAAESNNATYLWNEEKQHWARKVGKTVQVFNFTTEQWDNT